MKIDCLAQHQGAVCLQTGRCALGRDGGLQSGRRTGRGVAIIELALVLPLLLLIIFGSVDFGVALYNKAVITNSAREGARTGVLYDIALRDGVTDDDEVVAIVTNRVVTYCQNNLITFGEAPDPIVDLEFNDGGAVSPVSGNNLKVNVDFDYGALGFGALAGLFNDAITASATMVFE